MYEISLNHTDQQVHELLPLTRRERGKNFRVDAADGWKQAGVNLFTLHGEAWHQVFTCACLLARYSAAPLGLSTQSKPAIPISGQ
jgi:hypothetical protein